MANKTELRIIAHEFPDRFDDVDHLEQDVNARHLVESGAPETFASFFQMKTLPRRFRSLPVMSYNRRKGTSKLVMVGTVEDVRRWSMTSARKPDQFEAYMGPNGPDQTVLQVAARMMLQKDTGALSAMLADDQLSVMSCPKGYCE